MLMAESNICSPLQMETYKDLYVIALDKIQSLQLDLQDLQSLRDNMQAMSANMVGKNAAH